MRIDELRPQIGDFAMRMAFLVSKKVLFLAWQGAAKHRLRCNVDENENDDLDSRWLYDDEDKKQLRCTITKTKTKTAYWMVTKH